MVESVNSVPLLESPPGNVLKKRFIGGGIVDSVFGRREPVVNLPQVAPVVAPIVDPVYIAPVY